MPSTEESAQSQVQTVPQQQEPVAPTTTSGSGSSVVGRWRIQRDMLCDGHFSNDMTGIISFNEDGTLSGESQMWEYKWAQNGNTVSWGPVNGNPITEGGVTHNPYFHEGTINGNAMSGTWTCPSDLNPSGTNGCWNAVRV
jgi:hypothetical protein